ncbi:MAG: FecR domain-containing protein [Vicinamibacteraceae bacterium]|nr:FecR domain-containing protein [Vicinamibacteraceae bacterium]
MSDYLWDKRGEPDEEARRLESLLGSLRSRRGAPDIPSGLSRPPLRLWPLVAVAAIVLLALSVTWSRLPQASGGRWQVTWLEGTTWSDIRVVRETSVGAGEWVETGASRARLAVGDIGEVQLDPSTRVALVDTGQRDHRLSLARGRMHATIWAPPGQFYVETPAAVAVDLGCRYSLEVAADGSGILRVEAGWVGIEHGGRLALVPAGAIADTRTGTGPGTPHYEDASSGFDRALDVVDFGGAGAARREALAVVLSEARERDALSLWHLLTRTTGEDRGRVHDRLAALVPAPAGVTREGILRGDRAMLEAWWAELGLGSAEFWRSWTSPWTER